MGKKAAPTPKPKRPSRGNGGIPGGGLLPAALGVALTAWLLMYREPSAGPKADDTHVSEETPTDDKFSAVRERLFDPEGYNKRPDGTRNFSDKAYWDKRYGAKGQAERYDWYGVWDGPSKVTMKRHVLAFMPPVSSPILNVGCGNSRFPEELYDDGYKNLMNIDISQVAMERMAKDIGAGRKGLSFLQMDATSMSFEDSSFDAVFEKGTLDAMYAGSEALVKRTVAEVFRVLRPGGIFVSTTFGRPSSRRELNATAGESLEPGPLWAGFRAVAVEKETGRTFDISQEEETDAVFIYIMTKAGGGR